MLKISKNWYHHRIEHYRISRTGPKFCPSEFPFFYFSSWKFKSSHWCRKCTGQLNGRNSKILFLWKILTQDLGWRKKSAPDDIILTDKNVIEKNDAFLIGNHKIFWKNFIYILITIFILSTRYFFIVPD